MSPGHSEEVSLTLATAQRATRQPKVIYFKLLEARLNSLVRNEIIDKFWSHFPETFRKYGPSSHKPFMEAISFLRESSQKIEKTLGQAGQLHLRDKFFSAFTTQILSARPYYLNDYIESTYFRAFRAFLAIQKRKSRQRAAGSRGEPMDCDANDGDGDGAAAAAAAAAAATATADESDEEDYQEYDEYASASRNGAESSQHEDLCSGCSMPEENCECDSIYQSFKKMNLNLRHLELLDSLAGDTIMTVARAFCERRVATKGKSNYACSYLSELTQWVNVVVKLWFVDIYGTSNDVELKDISKKLDQYLKDAYAEVRVAHMFEIIIEYPNSEAAIQDLKLCLEQSTSSSFRLNLIDNVKQSLVESLLHPGVNTYDILTAYISAIKALRSLDPSGLILQLVTEPVRRYLKSRQDTVRCIVTALTDEDHNSELNREMIRSTQTNENGLAGKSGAIEVNLPNEGEKCTALNFEKWRPDPIELSSSDDVMKTSRFSDIVSILVNIYETKDLFVEEYQKLLSQRLLNKYDECNLDFELRNLELLTLRFSDCELHRCEVMLKDVQTSKRINKRILSDDIKDQKLRGFRNLDVLIVSSPFWPEKYGPIASLIEDEPPKVKFPAEIQSAIETYTKAFEAIQASRTLHWRHHLGFVNMDVTINGEQQNFNVSPLHAALLCLFQNKKCWRLHELMQETSLTAATVRSRLAVWQRSGIIKDCGDDKFELNT